MIIKWRNLTKEQRVAELSDFLAISSDSRKSVMQTVNRDYENKELLSKLADADLFERLLFEDNSQEEKKFKERYGYPIQRFKLPEFLKHHQTQIDSLKNQINALKLDAIRVIVEHLSE